MEANSGNKTYVLILAEETVHVFQSPICGFGIEEVDNGNERSVEDRPYDVELRSSRYSR